jgi:type I restriction enzyme S subunit
MNAVPEVRFPEFDGEWQESLLGQVVTFSNGKAHERDIVEDGPIVVVNSKFISTNGKVRKFSDSVICPIADRSLVMVMSDVPRGKALAKCLFLEDAAGYSLNQRICSLAECRSNNQFLLHVVSRNRYFLLFDSGVGQTNLRKQEVLDCPLILPTLPEQTKIAAFLGAVDNKIDALRRKHDGLKQFKAGLMQKLFSQELRFKRDDGSDYPDWEEKRLGDVLKVVMGQSPKSAAYNDQGDGWPLVQGNADMRGGKTAPQRHTTEAPKTCEAGDIIISVRAPVGKMATAIEPCCIGRGVAAIRPRTHESFGFWFQFLLGAEHYWRRLSQGSTFDAISGSDIKGLLVNAPHPDEQQKIADCLSAVDAKIEAVEGQITQMEAFKKGLLQKMFV